MHAADPAWRRRLHDAAVAELTATTFDVAAEWVLTALFGADRRRSRAPSLCGTSPRPSIGRADGALGAVTDGVRDTLIMVGATDERHVHGLEPMTDVAAHRTVPDRLVVPVGQGGRVLVCSDLHLASTATAASQLVTDELVERLSGTDPVTVVVLNGDCFELLAGQRPSVAAALDAHPRFETALRAHRDRGGRLVVTVGNHDGRLAWDRVASATIIDRLGGELCLVADLIVATARGERVVRVEHGHRFDAANAFRDPRNELDSPLGHHVVEEILPELQGRPYLRDVAWLADPNEFSRFLGSRVVYRQLLRRWWLVLAPLALVVLARTPLVVRALSDHRTVRDVERWFLVAVVGVLADLVVLGTVGLLVVRRVFTALATTRLGPRGSHLNELPRTAAHALCAEGFAGFVTGHTHHPELSPVTGGFYANTGCGVRTIESHPARWGLPPVFTGVHRRSWIELNAGHDLNVRVWLADEPVEDRTRLERWAQRSRRPVPAVPTVVGEFPNGVSWPIRHDTLTAAASRDRARRVGAVGTLLVAAIGLASSLTPPLRGRLRWLLGAMPIEIPQAA